MKKKFIIVVIAVLLVFDTIVAAYFLISKTNSIYTTHHYLVFVGLNDKDTGSQEISLEDAIEKIDACAMKYSDGYSIGPADGRWLDESGNKVVESTIICYFDRLPLETVHKIVDEILIELNQSCVFICENEVFAEYYYGNE